MVGYGSALRMARRPGWENAYLDYENLKLILTKIEAVYEEALALEANERYRGESIANLDNTLRASFEVEDDCSCGVYMGESEDDYRNSENFIGSAKMFERNSFGVDVTFGAMTATKSRDHFEEQENQSSVIFNNNGLPPRVISTAYSNTKNLQYMEDSPLLSTNHSNSYTGRCDQSEDFMLQPKMKKKKKKRHSHMRQAHRQAKQLAERFLGLLQSEVEKVSLFALSRQGELADTVGSLRFNDLIDSIESSGGLWNNPCHTHPSSSSSSENDGDGSSDSANDRRHSIVRKRGRKRNESTGLHHVRSRAMQGETARQRNLNSRHVQHSRPLFHRSDLIVAEDLMISTGVDEIDAYTCVGVELLHLLRFICVNAMAVRKILKKRDKLLQNCMLNRFAKNESNNLEKDLLGTADIHLQNLANSLAMDSISESLLSFLNEYKYQVSRAETLQKTKVSAKIGFKSFSPAHNELKTMRSESFDIPSVKALSASEHEGHSDETSSMRSSFSQIAMARMEYTIQSIVALRSAARVMNTPFDAYLHRSALLVTGQTLGGLSGSSREALDFLLTFDPDELYELDVFPTFRGVFRGTLSKNLDNSDVSFMTEVDMEDSKVDIDWATQYLNILSMFLFTVNYYIIAPTAPLYAISLGHQSSSAGIFIGVTSISAILSGFFVSYLSMRFSYRTILMLSTLCPIFGNVLYAYAFSLKSAWIAIFGRILLGFGNAETVNRDIIASTVPLQYLSRISGTFVGAGALGMSVGPLLAGIIDVSAGRDFSIDLNIMGGLVYNNLTAPGYLMSALWFLQLLFLKYFFLEPKIIRQSGKSSNIDDRTKLERSSSDIRVDLKEAYTSSGKIYQEHNDPIESSSVQQRQMYTVFREFPRIWRIIKRTKSILVALLVIFFIELIDEVIISSCSIITFEYFDWKPISSGLMVTSLGILVLPATLFAELLSKSYLERQLMLVSLIIVTISLFGLLNVGALAQSLFYLGQLLLNDKASDGSTAVTESYDWNGGVYQYVVAGSLSFMGTLFLESVVMSLMSKACPAKLHRGFMKLGLLAATVGIFGRITGDIIVVMAGLVRHKMGWDYVNSLMIPVILLCIIGIVYTKKYYFHLIA